MSVIDHVSELRAELAGAILTAQERAALEAELEAALTGQAGACSAPNEAELA